jgi:hypothetical protein
MAEVELYLYLRIQHVSVAFRLLASCHQTQSELRIDLWKGSLLQKDINLTREHFLHRLRSKDSPVILAVDVHAGLPDLNSGVDMTLGRSTLGLFEACGTTPISENCAPQGACCLP